MSVSGRIRTVMAQAAAVGLLATVTVHAQAQVRLVTDKKSSLAWWQINPHMNHLWATTCPGEPSWRPGEGRSAGWVIGRAFRPAKHGDAGVSDTTIVPLYPRRRVRPVCVEAVEGRVVVADTAKWSGVSGEVSVRADALISGEDNRDEFTREKILQTNTYPDVKYRIDSIVDVRRSRDTLRAMAHGVLTLRGVTQPAVASLRFWPEEGGMRVLGKLRIPAHDLIPVYGVSGLALGLGVGVRIWEHVYMGVDLMMRPSEAAASSH
jgi:hypothetical protein